MTRYYYECCKCGAFLDGVHTAPTKCSSCETLSCQAGPSPASLDTAYHRPIEMFSVAPMGADEYDTLRRKLPDVEFTPQLVPIAHNLAEKRRILKATGFEDRSGRG